MCGGRSLKKPLAAEVVGRWTTVRSSDDLSGLNEVHGLSPLRFNGRSLSLSADGTCVAPLNAPSVTPRIPDDGLGRHPSDRCQWTLGEVDMKDGAVSAVHVSLTQAGYSRGVTFPICEKGDALRLCAATGDVGYIELRRE
jgi:hypothetical protein